MEFDERLQRAFDALADDLHQEIAARLVALRADVSASVRDDRQAAVAEADREARAGVEREVSQRVSDAVTRASTEAQADLSEAQKASTDRLLEAVRTIDEGKSLSDILDVLIAAASTEAGRAALFLPHGQTLKSWRLIGFDPPAGTGSTIELPFAEGDMIAEAAGSARLVRLDSSSPRTIRPAAFANLPDQSQALAVPLVMSEQVFAVLYVDEGGRQSPARLGWPGTIEVLARHAARALEAVTATRLAQVAEVVAR